nr:MAG TPA: LysW biosynthesis protein LysW [Caudoviricetes sp.]
MLFIRNDVENGPENQIIHSCLAELRHDGSDVKRQFEKTLNPACRGFLLSGDTTGVFAKVHCTSTPVISPVQSNLIFSINDLALRFSRHHQREANMGISKCINPECEKEFTFSIVGEGVPGGKELEELCCPYCGTVVDREMMSGSFLTSKIPPEQKH